eukprot:CAMPEP_0179088900 /NCGR_PEP_ID=MMETSP0796-20121207/40475_1 /TAXON_ID=73915 /ORGANISM="Pyrodinium bahamense, Strain pbaha01" /LENGTH=153 /DNA_ID=CAMNT_0020786439 /DNA_START=80 /DNA_END=541 /DNA_ORIENTATION=-
MSPSGTWRALLLCCLAGGVTGTRRSRESMGVAVAQHSERFWPFTAGTEAPPPRRAATTRAPSLQDAKGAVMASVAFIRKTSQLCRNASESEQQMCREVAGERLFCALLRRHSQQYQGMVGAAEAHAKCSSVDMMENVLEAAQDAKLQEEVEKP